MEWIGYIMKITKFLRITKAKIFLLLLILISFLIARWPDASHTAPSHTPPEKQPGKKHKRVPASLLKWPKEGSDYAVLVDKSLQKVFLYQRDKLYSPVRVYKCSTGENGGPKSTKNDKKTPEGIYFFTQSYEKKDLAPIYGIRAFPIDYPNSLDRKVGRGGYGIWFHGTNKPLKPYDSNGCIVLNNPDIDELTSYIKLNDTPVIISSKLEMIHPQKLKEDAGKLERIIENWRRAWEKKELDKYMSFYGSVFSSGEKNRKQWRDHKTRLAKKYKSISVETENLRLLKNSGVVLARFKQRYRTPVFDSLGDKRLFLQKNSNQWKIVGEYFKGQESTKPAAPKKPSLSGLKKIKAFIYSWKEAWEKKDFKTYIACYDNKFRSRGMNLKAWKRHRKRLNKKYRSIKVELDDLIIVQNSSQTSRVSFRQSYWADGYHDVGLKRIFLTIKGKRWKIKKEEWSPLGGKPNP